MGVSLPEPPVTKAVLATSASAAAAALPAFDPFKPLITRVTPKPTRQGVARAGTEVLAGAPSSEKSIAELRVEKLRARQARLEASGIPPRKTVLLRRGDLALPADHPLTARAAGASGSATVARGSGSGSGAGAGAGAGASRAPSDAQMLRDAMRRKKEDRARAEQLSTPAMRELQRLRKATVFKTALIKVQFPDLVMIQGQFNPTERVSSVVEWVRQLLLPTMPDFDLFVRCVQCAARCLLCVPRVLTRLGGVRLQPSQGGAVSGTKSEECWPRARSSSECVVARRANGGRTCVAATPLLCA